MSEQGGFSYERFMSAQQIALFQGDMLIPLNNATIPIPPETIQRLVDEFDTYDPPHLIYAIEICDKRAPAIVARHLPRLLSNKDSSVQAAVARALFRLPPECVDSDLIASVRQSLAGVQQDRQYGLRDLLPDLEKKLLLRHGSTI
jgi:hypothetical protein